MDESQFAQGTLAKARNIILQYGWNTTAYQILNPGLKLWFSAAEDAVIGYVDCGSVRVVAGAPVCAVERLSEVVKEFEQDPARRKGKRVCYFASDSRLENLLTKTNGYGHVLVGAQPIWNPKSWPSIVDKHASLRAQLFRAKNKFLQIREWPPQKAATSLDIRRCLTEWLQARPMPAMHFLVEPETLERLWDRRIFVAEREGIPVGFLVVTPVPARKGWLVEQIIRGQQAPNGTAEILVDAAFKVALQEGYEYFTLGLSPLSQALSKNSAYVEKQKQQPWWVNLLFQGLRAHASRFYDFRGLENFKTKFAPEAWEPIYAIYNRPKLSPLLFLSIASAFGGMSPLLFVLLALGRAVRQESIWLSHVLLRNLESLKIKS